MTKRIAYVCQQCGSNEVVADAWAYWDVDRQDWLLRNTADVAFCGQCEGETSFIEIELHPRRDMAA